MTQYHFGGSLYRNSREMHEACAAEYLTAGGRNNRDMMLEALTKTTDAEMVADAWDGWNLGEDESGDNRAPFSKDELEAAFADLRKDFDKRFPANDD